MAKLQLTILACLGLSSALWASGKTTVDLELHNSTTSLAVGSEIHSSTNSVVMSSATDSAHLDTLVLELQNPSNERGRLKAINDVTALGVKAKPVTPDLLHLLLDPSAGAAAARALQTIDPNTPIPPATLNRLVRRAEIPPQRVRVHGAWLTQCDEQTNALDTLAALGPAAHSTIPDLVKLTYRFCVHDHVLAALDAMGEPDAAQISQIAAGLDDKNPETRQAALEFLAKSRADDAETIKILGHAMNDPNSGVRLSALQALEAIHPEGEGRLPLLMGFLQDPSPEIRERAVYMIGQLAPEAQTAKPLLYQALKDSDPAIALSAAKLLLKLDPQDPVLLHALLGFMKVKGSPQAAQSAQILESLNVHNAQIDAALEPYRAQLALGQQMNKVGSVSPQQLAENARSLKVSSIRIASGIVNNLPIQVGRSFPGDVGRVYCWTDVSVSSTPSAIVHQWFKGGKIIHEETLNVSDTSVQLWSSFPVTQGDWTIKVLPSNSDETLATTTFIVHPRHK